MTHAALVERAVFENPLLAPLLDRWAEIALPDCWLVAGAVTQSVWNLKTGRQLGHGLRDIDIVYHDPSDLSLDAEQAHEARLRLLFPDAGARLDVKNEARVHLWYQRAFGYPIPPYPSTQAAIATFPTTATAIGIRPGEKGLEVCAPFGLDDLCNLIVRPNKAQITRPIYDAKHKRWRSLWPELHILDW